MKLLFMSNLFPKETKIETQSRMKFNMYDAADVLQWNLIHGLEMNHAPVSLLNLLPVDSWPQYYSQMFVKRYPFFHKSDSDNLNVGFCNIKYLKRFFMKRAYVAEAKKWEKKTRDEESRCILAYSLNQAFIAGIKAIKRRDSSVRAVAVVADLPEFSAPSRNILRRIYRYFLNKSMKENIAVFDGFVLLTEHMAQRMEINMPYMVMEGIAEACNLAQSSAASSKTIFYSGSMNAKYGITVLLEAFSKIQDPHMRLVLCGLGDAQELVSKAAQVDGRISYLGKVVHERVRQLQQEATVLVNPRQNNEEFTKYSFPSKTMEYLASGVPVVAYKLDGIPDEYDQFLNYVTDNSAESLAAKLMQICDMDELLRRELGRKGAEFVQQNKNAIIQSRRILEFIRAL